MTKQELIEKVAATPGLPAELTKKAVATLVDAVFAELGDYFVKRQGHAPRHAALHLSRLRHLHQEAQERAQPDAIRRPARRS